ncbi:MAG: serine/threonine-protein kinase [Planctomycetota bacterium]|nr:serine/threonine-protein kinase [Planctomycetota bacterium]
MSNSITELIQNLTESGLLSDSEISAIQESIGSRPDITSAEGFARELVRQNHLTKLQAAAVLKGKTRNLVFGEYVVLEKIGTGGMGQVFKARHRPTSKLVAVKVLSADAVKNRRLIERFKKEARAVARLKHPNIVRAFEAGKINRIRYLVMEYVEGENMLARVKRKGPLPVDECIRCVLEAARGLDYAHQKGIVHRDIKPSNLLRDKKTARVKVLDMGLARVDEPDEDEVRLTMPGQMLGTARFMSPEQVEDARKADVRSDVYSLGCTLYFLLRSKAPYSGETVAHTLMAHVSSPIPDLCQKRPDTPKWLGDVFQKMLAKKPRDRFQTMSELVETIQHHLGEDLSRQEEGAFVLDVVETEDEYAELIADRSDEGSSLEHLFSDDERDPAVDEFHDPDAPAGAHLVAIADQVGEDEVTTQFANRSQPMKLDEEDLDFAAIEGEDDGRESQRMQGFPASGAAMNSVQAFDLNAPDEEIAVESEVSNVAGEVNSTPASEASGGLSDDDGPTVDGDYLKRKMANRELREQAATRRFQLAGLVTGVVIVLGIVGYLVFGGG